MELHQTTKEYQLLIKKNWQDIKCKPYSWTSTNFIKVIISTIFDQWELISIEDFAGTTIVKIYWNEHTEKKLEKTEQNILKDWNYLIEECSKLENEKAIHFCNRYAREIDHFGERVLNV